MRSIQTMNYYQSLNTNSKTFFLAYQICKLEKILLKDKLKYECWENDSTLDKNIKFLDYYRLIRILNNKKLKLKLLRKV